MAANVLATTFGFAAISSAEFVNGCTYSLANYVCGTCHAIGEILLLEVDV